MEEEISLREIVEILINGRKLIALITLISILASGIISFFVLSPTYEAQAVIHVRQEISPDDSDYSGDFMDVLDAMTKYSTFDLETYRTQIKNNIILQQVIEELELEKLGYTPGKLGLALKVERVGDSNMLSISIERNDPVLAADIVNTLTDKYLQYISEQKKKEIAASTKFIYEQMERTEEQLQTALEELKVFLKQPRGVNELSSEIDLVLNQLTYFKYRLNELEVDHGTFLSERESINRELAETPSHLVTKKSIIEDQFLHRMTEELGDLNPSQSSGLQFESEEINPNYLYLTQRLSDVTIEINMIEREIGELETSTTKLEEDLEKLQVEYAEKEILHNDLQRRVDNHNTNFQTLSEKYTTAEMTESVQAGRLTLTVVSSAYPPETPSGPKRMLNMAVSGVLGIMVSVFIVFFKHYWQETGAEQKEQTEKKESF